MAARCESRYAARRGDIGRRLATGGGPTSARCVAMDSRQSIVAPRDENYRSVSDTVVVCVRPPLVPAIVRL